MLNVITKLMQENKNIALIGHIMPDGDTIGSCLALGYALESQGKDVSLFCQDEIPDNLCFLKGCKKFQSEIVSYNTPFDLIITLDCSDPERLGVFQTLLESSSQTINIITMLVIQNLLLLIGWSLLQQLLVSLYMNSSTI